MRQSMAFHLRRSPIIPRRGLFAHLAGAFLASALLAGGAGAAAAQGQQEDIAFSPPPISAYAELIERPLFSRSRKAYAAPRPAPVAVAAPAPRAEAPRNSNFQLSGVIFDGEDFIALIRTNAGADLMEVRQGEIVEGWTVDAIGAEEIRLRRNGGEDVVSLRDNELTAAQRRALASATTGAGDRDRARRLSQLQERRRQRAEQLRAIRNANNGSGAQDGSR